MGPLGSLAGAGGWVDSWLSVINVVISLSPLAVITAVTTSITLVGHASKRILTESEKAMGWQ